MNLAEFSCILLTLPFTSHQSGDLPNSIRPERYDIFLDSDFDTWTYTGTVNIALNVLEEINEIFLHAVEAVNIETMVLCDRDGTNNITELTVGPRQNKAQDLIVFSLPTSLRAGTYVIKSKFSGSVSSTLTGYFKTSYEMNNSYSGKKQNVHITSTHLSPDKARTVFPSFDEPQFRAIFSLTLVHPDNITATSNMPVLQTISLDNGRKLTKFHDTPKMSTYLLVWVQHNFVFAYRTMSSLAKEVELRHFIPAGGDFNFTSVAFDKLDLLERIIVFFNDFFEIPYPLPKLDMIGIPNFPFGGMENWGLVTLNQYTSLSERENRLGSAEIAIRNVLAHEVSHMWFGNLVTMSWWDDLWLKEGMASLLSYVCIDGIYDDVEMRDHHMIDNWLDAMLADREVSSHPVKISINATSEITQAFDSITYAKGATVLSMLRDVLGNEKFKSGMKHFLKSYQYSTASYNDLLESMTSFVEDKAIIKQFMDSFILKKNYPVVTVEMLANCKIRLSQSRYATRGGKSELKDDSSNIWAIPITIRSYTKVNSSNMLVKSHIMMTNYSMDIDFNRTCHSIKLNFEGNFMYVTHYPENNLNKLLEIANNIDSPMSYRDRGHVICDVFNAAMINLIPYSRAFEAARILQKEEHYLPWTLAYKYILKLREIIDESLADCFNQYISKLIAPQQHNVLSRNATLKDQLKKEIFLKYKNDLSYSRKQSSLSKKELLKLKNYKLHSVEERAEGDIMFAITNSSKIERIGNALIKYPSSDSMISVIFVHFYSKCSPDAVWSVYKKNYDHYNANYGLTQFVYAELLRTMIGYQRSVVVISEIDTFFVDHPAGAGSLGVISGLEAAKFSSDFRNDSQAELRNYFEQHGFCKSHETSNLNK